MKNSNSELGQYIRMLRLDKEQTLHDVSMGTDIDSPMLSKIERGDRLPTNAQITRLAKYYKIPESSLLSKVAAQKILREYGANEVTLDAISIVKEEIVKYAKSKR